MVTASDLADAIGALRLSRFHIAQWLFAGVLVFIANGAVGASLPWIELDLRARLELTPLAESLILVAAPFGAFVGALASGALSDRFGRRRILLLALTILGAAHASIGVAPSPGALVVLLWLRYFAYGQPEGIAKTLLAEILPARRRGLLLNLVHPIWQLGGIALALTTTWDAEADSMRVLGTPVTGGQLAFASALPAFVALLAVAIGVRESPLFTLHARGPASAVLAFQALCKRCGAPAPTLPGAASGTTEMVAPAAEGDSVGMLGNKSTGACCGCGAARPPAGGSWRRLWTPALRRRTCVVLAVWFFLAMPYESTDFFFIRYLHDAGRANLMQPVARAQYAAKTLGGTFGALVVDCIGRRRLLVPTFAIASAATFGLYFAPTDGGGGALLAVVGAYYSATEIVWSTLKTFTVELFPTEARGKAIGACTGVGFVGSSCALFVGPLLMAYAHPALPFLLNAIMLACGAVLICALARETARAALAE